MSRNTNTGKVLEDMILPAIKRGQYSFKQGKIVGERLDGGSHKVDCFLTQQKIIISLKWQQSNGTAEQKIPYEIMCLGKALLNGEANRAYLILGGTDSKGRGWTLRDFYINGGLDHYLHSDYKSLVKILKTDDFIALANKGSL